MKPWRQIARPHKDVLEGTFKQADFAADISEVVKGHASPEYQDAEKFFARTYITEGMRLLLISVAQRLAGKSGDPVIQLQTNFGGGKTHTLLAVYHLATRSVPLDKLAGIPSLLADADVNELPKAKIAVIDGINLSPNQPMKRDTLIINTVWGQLAYQLLGMEGYEMVAESDKAGTAPGKEIVSTLLKKAAPCVLLMDELVSFFRQLDGSKVLTAGSYESNISFIQILTESVKMVPNAILLASLPESDTEAAGSFGQVVLSTLEKFFGRVESVWKPVASNEAFEIVRRRLFDSIGDATEMEATCREYSDFYRKNKDKLPPEVQESTYQDRMRKSYPIHPEIFDRLYEDWSTLDKFQKTRGVLQYMAIIIHRLWNSNDQDPLIMPGSIPLDDVNVRIKSTQYLPPGWDPIIEKEIDGIGSAPFMIDGKDTRFGSIKAATRAARTIFLGSAPSTPAQVARGIMTERILLGCAIPGQTLSIYEDVLKRLRDMLHYLFVDIDRFWYDTRPNLRREMETRKGKVESIQLQKTIRETLIHICGHGAYFSGIHVFTNHEDIPDDIGHGPRLVVLPLDSMKAYSKANPSMAFNAAKDILEHRGEQPRIRRNRLIFLVPDLNVVNRALEQGKIYLAWHEIVTDIDEGRLNLDIMQAKQARKEKDIAQQILKQALLECYRMVMVPVQKTPREVSFEVNRMSYNAGSTLATQIENKLSEEEAIVLKWSPVHLKKLLDSTYFTNGQTEVSVQKVWLDCCSYFQLPRLLNEEVFKRAITEGVTKGDFFGFAMGKEGDQYQGFEYAHDMFTLGIDAEALLIENETAKAYQLAHPPKKADEKKDDEKKDDDRKDDEKKDDEKKEKIIHYHHYFADTELSPLKATIEVQNIITEIISNFTTKPGVNVSMTLHIEADSDAPFDEGTIRTIKENATVLKLKSSDFSKD